MFEEEIQFRERATGWFGDSEVSVDYATKAYTALEAMLVASKLFQGRTQKNAVSFFQFHAEGLTMYGVKTPQIIPITLL